LVLKTSETQVNLATYKNGKFVKIGIEHFIITLVAYNLIHRKETYKVALETICYNTSHFLV
jgi:hypothetical protein